jgi:TRAP-type C4-dicarboxylate transport system substrate-binding protein
MVIGTVAAMAIILAASLASAKITIKYSDHDPPGGMRPKFIQEIWMPEMIKQTNGKIQFQDFWGGALLGGSETLKGTADNVTNMAFVCPEFFSKQLVAHDAFKLFPVGPGKWKSVLWLYKKAYAEIPELNAELKKWNQKVLLTATGLPLSFNSTSPITKVSDLKGNKWRASSRWLLAYLQNAGAVPVSVPWADCYMALQTGTVDGVMTNYDGMHMTKLDEAGPNILVAKELWYGTPFIHTVNLDFWNDLPKDVQDGIMKATEIANEKFGQAFDNTFAEIKKAQEKAGYKVTIMSQDDIKKWQELTNYKALQEQWVKEAKEQGLDNAQAIMDKMRELHKKAMEMDQK